MAHWRQLDVQSAQTFIDRLGYTYVDEEAISEHLRCAICKDPLVDPVIAPSPCSHCFCRRCITHWLRQSCTCPLDRAVMAADDLTSAAKIIQRLVDDIEVMCPLGCGWAGSRATYKDHLIRRCPAVEVDGVPRGHRGRIPIRADLPRPPRPMTSMGHSSFPSSTSASTSTSRSLASDPLLPCPYAKHGCPFSAESVSLLSSHLPQCRAMLGFVTRTRHQLADEHARVQELERELAKLRMETSGLLPRSSSGQRSCELCQRAIIATGWKCSSCFPLSCRAVLIR